MDIIVAMKSGKEFNIAVHARDIEHIAKAMSKNKFIRLGRLVLNTSEIEYVMEEL